MKIIVTAIAIASATLLLHGEGVGRVDIKTQEDIERIASVPEWTHGKSTNSLTVSVLVGTAHIGLFSFPLCRDLTFDAEGRLVHASKVSLMDGRDLRRELSEALDSHKNRGSLVPRGDRRDMDAAIEKIRALREERRRELECRRRPVEK